MSGKNQLDVLLKYWADKSTESLEAAKDELKAGRISFSVNRIYYSCFYIVSAALLKDGHKFHKHSGVRAAFHKNLVKPGLVSLDLGEFYDALYEARQRGDYIELVSFDKKLVEDWLKKAKRFAEAINSIIR